MDGYVVSIENIELLKNKVRFVINITGKQIRKNNFSFKLNDFDEIWNGEIVHYNRTMHNFIVEFTLSNRFKQFKDGILKTTFKTNDKELAYYNTIYSLDYTEVYDDSIDKVEEYFDDAEEVIEQTKYTELVENEVDDADDLDENLNDSVEIDLDFVELEDFDEQQTENSTDTVDWSRNYLNIKQLNGYDDSWLSSIKPDGWTIRKTEYQGDETLDFDFTISYNGTKGTILKDFKVYITDLKGRRIFTTIYLTSTFPIPDEIDIWCDNEIHSIRLGPCFLIKDIGELVDGIRITVCFTDSLQKYIVRKTFTLNNNFWYHEELVAIPL